MNDVHAGWAHAWHEIRVAETPPKYLNLSKLQATRNTILLVGGAQWRTLNYSSFLTLSGGSPPRVASTQSLPFGAGTAVRLFGASSISSLSTTAHSLDRSLHKRCDGWRPPAAPSCKCKLMAFVRSMFQLAAVFATAARLGSDCRGISSIPSAAHVRKKSCMNQSHTRLARISMDEHNTLETWRQIRFKTDDTSDLLILKVARG